MTFRQTAETNLLQSVFRCLYSTAKIFVFAVNSLRKPAFLYFCVVYLRIRRTERKNKSEVIFTVCRLPYTSCLNSLLHYALTETIISVTEKTLFCMLLDFAMSVTAVCSTFQL